uniref:hypothetical protein n=1 Tax=Flavobacterium sp. TaxID=239 RepID=UPI003BA6893A
QLIWRCGNSVIRQWENGNVDDTDGIDTGRFFLWICFAKADGPEVSEQIRWGYHFIMIPFFRLA